MLRFAPLPEDFPLVALAVKAKNEIHGIPEAVLLEDEEAALHLNMYGPTSSLSCGDQGDDSGALFKGRGETVRSVAAKTASLRSLAKEHPSFQCTSIKLDLAGVELSALHRGREILQDSVLAVVSETRFRTLYVGK